MKTNLQDLNWKKRQLEIEISSGNSLYIQSKITRVVFDLIQNKKIPYFNRLNEIHEIVKDIKEPNNYNTYKLDYPENLIILESYYKEVIEIINTIIENHNNS